MQAMFCSHLYLEFRGCFLPLLSLRPCTSCCPSSIPCCAMHSAPCRAPPQQGPGQGNLLLPVWHSCSVHKNTFLLFHSTVGKKKSWVPSTCNYLWWYLKAMSKVNKVGLQTTLVPWHKMAFRSQSCENQISWLTATAPVAFFLFVSLQSAEILRPGEHPWVSASCRPEGLCLPNMAASSAPQQQPGAPAASQAFQSSTRLSPTPTACRWQLLGLLDLTADNLITKLNMYASLAVSPIS